MRLVMILIFWGSISHARGGDIAGNGGDVVICPSGSPFMVNVLDEFEAVSLRQLTPLPTLATNYLDIAKELLDKSMRSRLPALTENLKAEVDAFPANALIYPGTLADISDSDQILLPAGCNVAQVAINRVPNMPGDSIYVIDQNIWQNLSERQKALVILHEVIYRQSALNGAPNSIPARYVVGAIFTGTFASSFATDKTLFDFFFDHLKYFHFEKGGLATYGQNANLNLQYDALDRIRAVSFKDRIDSMWKYQAMQITEGKYTFTRHAGPAYFPNYRHILFMNGAAGTIAIPDDQDLEEITDSTNHNKFSLRIAATRVEQHSTVTGLYLHSLLRQSARILSQSGASIEELSLFDLVKIMDSIGDAGTGICGLLRADPKLRAAFSPEVIVDLNPEMSVICHGL